MTKRKLFCALCVVFCLFLTACGEKDAQVTPSGNADVQASPSQSAEPEIRPFEDADVQAVLAADVFSEKLEAVDAELVYGLYGLSADAVTGCTAYLSTGASAEEIVLFTVSGEDGLTAVENACEWRLEDQMFGYKDYKPTEVPKIENAIVEVRENTVLFVVANDWEAAEDVIAGLN